MTILIHISFPFINFQDVMELLCRPNLEETEEHVSVLEAKKEPYSACKSSQDWKKPTLEPNPLLYDNEPLLSPTTSTTTDFTLQETLHIDRNPKDSTENPSAGTNSIQNQPNVLVPESVSTAVAHAASAFMSDYTTMELFQQITKAAPPVPSSSGASTAPGQEYLQQPFSSSRNTGSAPDQMCLTDSTVKSFSNCV